MRTISYGVTDVGLKRDKNEDNLLINDELNLFVVADGMGGHAGGEFASQIAVSTIESFIVQNLDNELTDPKATQDTTRHPITEKLKRSIQMAGDTIYQKAVQNPDLRGMGTTTVAMMLANGKAFIAYVGDSRIYLVRQGQCKQLTEDHSLVNEQVKAGIISAEDAKNHQLRNIITRSVGYQEEVEIDTLIVDVQPSDRLLMCSDGLSNFLEDREIADLLGKQELQDSAQDLVDLAIERGGDDNITLIVLEVIDQ